MSAAAIAAWASASSMRTRASTTPSCALSIAARFRSISMTSAPASVAAATAELHSASLASAARMSACMASSSSLVALSCAARASASSRSAFLRRTCACWRNSLARLESPAMAKASTRCKASSSVFCDASHSTSSFLAVCIATRASATSALAIRSACRTRALSYAKRAASAFWRSAAVRSRSVASAEAPSPPLSASAAAESSAAVASARCCCSCIMSSAAASSCAHLPAFARKSVANLACDRLCRYRSICT